MNTIAGKDGKQNSRKQVHIPKRNPATVKAEVTVRAVIEWAAYDKEPVARKEFLSMIFDIKAASHEC